MLILSISKKDVWDEVVKVTSLSGQKMTDDEDAYKRIFITQADISTLDRLWSEAMALANDRLKAFISSSPTSPSGDYSVTLELSPSYDDAMSASVNVSLRGFFVGYIIAKWYRFTNKGEADEYMAESSAKMEETLRKLYSRKRPTRTQRNA